MKPTIPALLQDEKNIPLTDDNYFLIHQKQREELIHFVNIIDSISENEWKTWKEEDKMHYSIAIQLADRVLRHSKMK